MFLQKSKKFHNVLSFETNGLALNYRFFSILSKLTIGSPPYFLS